MKIAITGASGHLGTAIIKEATKKLGTSGIIGITRTPEKAKHLGIEIRKADYNSREEYTEALKDIEVLLIISGNDMPEKRSRQHRNVIGAAKTTGIRKIVYSSIIGEPGKCAFDDIILSNRQTEKDIMISGLEWSIGRNGLYLEPDLDSLPVYFKEGKISNCAGNGKCPYTVRSELAVAYVRMITDNKHNNQVYNLSDEPITQKQLVNAINEVYGSHLMFLNISPEEYLANRIAVHGEILGSIVGGIYDGISKGTFDVIPDFEKAAGRRHTAVIDFIRENKK